MRTHDLKIAPKYFAEVRSGNKRFEVRKNDRDFKTGDAVILKEWSLETGYIGRTCSFTIGYVLPLSELFEDGCDLVVFSLLDEG